MGLGSSDPRKNSRGGSAPAGRMHRNQRTKERAPRTWKSGPRASSIRQKEGAAQKQVLISRVKPKSAAADRREKRKPAGRCWRSRQPISQPPPKQAPLHKKPNPQAHRAGRNTAFFAVFRSGAGQPRRAETAHPAGR